MYCWGKKKLKITVSPTLCFFPFFLSLVISPRILSMYKQVHQIFTTDHSSSTCTLYHLATMAFYLLHYSFGKDVKDFQNFSLRIQPNINNISKRNPCTICEHHQNVVLSIPITTFAHTHITWKEICRNINSCSLSWWLQGFSCPVMHVELIPGHHLFNRLTPHVSRHLQWCEPWQDDASKVLIWKGDISRIELCIKIHRQQKIW